MVTADHNDLGGGGGVATNFIIHYSVSSQFERSFRQYPKNVRFAEEDTLKMYQ